MPAKGAKGAKAAFADKAVTAFHKKVFDAVVRHIDWEVVRCLVLAGPGSAKDAFRQYLELEMVRQNVRSGRLHRVPCTLSLLARWLAHLCCSSLHQALSGIQLGDWNRLGQACAPGNCKHAACWQLSCTCKLACAAGVRLQQACPGTVAAHGAIALAAYQACWACRATESALRA